MKVKLILMSLLFGLVPLSSMSQENDIVELKIGDRVPDFIFEDLYNTQIENIFASELYNKGLLIINFWATWCVPCIREMPYFDELQVKLKENYSMVSVTRESDEIVQKFLNKNSKIKNLPIMSNDKYLNKYFPHRVIPHNIWIDKEGIVRAITDDYMVNEDNIEKFLAGDYDFNSKIDDMSFDYMKPLQVESNSFLYRSILSPYQEKIGNSGVLSPNSKLPNRYLGWNQIKTRFIWSAFMKTTMLMRDYNFMEIYTADSSSFFFPSFLTLPGKQRQYKDSIMRWSKNNLFCYELSYPSVTSMDAFYKHMQTDVSSIFNVDVTIESRERECWVIVENDIRLIPPPSVLIEKRSLHITGKVGDNIKIVAKNQTMDQIASKFTNIYSNHPPFVNKTNFDYAIDIYKDFGKLKDGLEIEYIKEYLKEIGLTIKKERVLYPCLIVYDKN